MAARRLALKLTQDQVASQIIFSPKSGSRRNRRVVLSRNAYAMYESEGAEPDLAKLLLIAKALSVTPEWLILGVGEHTHVAAYSYDSQRKQLVAEQNWIIPEGWLSSNFGVLASDIKLVLVSDFYSKFVPGEIAIVKPKTDISAIGNEFAIIDAKGKLCITHATRPHKSDFIRVFASDTKSHEEFPLDKVQIIGRVIGKLSALERPT